MKNKSFFAALSIFLSYLLVACGGGNSGNGGPTTFTVDGTGSKGLLSGALVQAYTYDANGVKTRFGDSVKTDANGRYVLTLSASSKPVVIEITAIAGTKMLDETAALVGGNFPSVDAPSGLVIRTGLPSLGASATVQANIYTEAAVYAALNAKDSVGNPVPLSSAVFDAASGAIRAAMPAGVNPFTIRGIKANDPDATDNEKMLTTLFAGVAQTGRGLASSCSKDTTGIACAIDNINLSSQIVVDGSNRATFADPTGQQATNQSVVDAAKTVTNAFVNTVKATLPDAVMVTEPVDPVVVAGQDSLLAFIQSMREGFKATETTLKTAAEDFTQRTRNLSAVADYTGSYELANAIKGCQYNNVSVVCTNTSGPDGVTYSLSNGFYSYYFLFTSNGSYYKVTGNVTPTVDNPNKSFSLSVVANRVLIPSLSLQAPVSKKISDTTAVYSVVRNASAVSSNCTACSANLSFSSKVYDSLDQNKFATLSLTNGTVTVTVVNGSATNAALSGAVTFTSPDGDNLAGTLSFAAAPVAGDASPSAQMISFSFTFSGRLGNTNVANGSFTGSRDYANYKPSLPYSSTNVPKDTLTLNLTLAGSSGLTITVTPSVTDITKRTGTIKLNADSAHFVTLTQPQQFSYIYGKWDWNKLLGTKTTLTSSSGGFTAQLDLTDTFTGPLMKGTTQIGEIRDNVIYVNGQEVSLY